MGLWKHSLKASATSPAGTYGGDGTRMLLHIIAMVTRVQMLQRHLLTKISLSWSVKENHKKHEVWCIYRLWGEKRKNIYNKWKKYFTKYISLCNLYLRCTLMQKKKKIPHLTKPRFIFFLCNISTHYEQVCVLNTWHGL